MLQQLAQGDEAGALRELKTAHEQLMAQAQAAEPAPEQEIGVPGGKAGPGRGNKTVANGHGFKPASQLSSNSWDRILPRLARDAPEVLERVKAGEFRSARAAAIEAGIVKPVPTIRLMDQFAEAGDNQHTLKDGGDNVTTKANDTAKGNSAAYLAARLKKAERDDLLKV